MLTVILIAVTLGQCVGPNCPTPPPQQHAMTDESGQIWTSPDPVWLAQWVGIRNRKLATFVQWKNGGIAQPNTGIFPENAGAPVGASLTARPGVPSTGPAVLNYGVDVGKMPHLVAGKHWHGGNVPESVGATDGPTFSKADRLHLTVIGADAKDVLKRWRKDPDFQRVERDYGDRLMVQAYPPDSPMVTEVGLADGGRPDVVIQASDGKVLYRSHVDPGADAVVGEIRKRDPSYDPRRDWGEGSSVAVFLGKWGLVLVAAVGFFLLVRKAQ